LNCAAGQTRDQVRTLYDASWLFVF